MGSLGFMEMAFILVLALLIFGPKRLPEVGRTLGRGMKEFRRATSDLKRSIEHEIDLDDSPRYERPQSIAAPRAGDGQSANEGTKPESANSSEDR